MDNIELRDCFAGQALAGLLASKEFGSAESVAAAAYYFANAMIKARKEQEATQ